MSRAVSARPYTLIAIGLLCVLFSFTVYKAWTQSITLDEAYTYKIWVAAPFSSFYTVSGYNNHPLNTLFCRLVVAGLGPSEIALRLPSVLLGLVYLLAVYRIAVLLFGDSFWMLLTVALNCANPLVLDHFATARGYGMGVAFWALGIYLVLRCISEPAGTWRWIAAGAALGLSAASYMTEAFAVAAVIVVLTVLYGRRALILGASAFAVAAPILYGPLRLARAAFIDGEITYRMALKTFLAALVNYKPGALASYRFGWHVLDRWPYGILLGFLGLLLISTVVLVIRWRRAKSLAGLDETDRRLLVVAPVVLATFALLRVEPVVLHHVFFGGRRLLFTAPLLLLAGPLFFFWLERQWARAGLVAGRMGAVVLSLLALHSASMLKLDSFWGWEYDAGSKTIAGILRERKPASPRPPVRVGATWLLESSLNYYRALYGMDWIAPVKFGSPDCFYDYYAVGEGDLAGLSRFAPQVLYRSPVAGTVLAELGPAIRARLVALERVGFSRQPACLVDLTQHEPFATAGKPGVNGHILSDVMGSPDTAAQRWTFERPAFLFYVSDTSNLKFHLDFQLPIHTYSHTGPVRLTVWINGRRLAEQLYSAPEFQSFERPVPPQWLGEDGLALVETTLDKYFIAPEDKQKLGYLFVSGGFVN